jgi:hypothetical protein
MANNQLLASDNFASGSLAAGWAAAPGYSECVVVSGSPNVTEAGALSTVAGQLWTGLTWPDDQISELTSQALTSESGTILVLWVRLQSGAQSGYQVNLSDGSATLSVQTAGTGTNLTTANGLTFAAGDVWTLAAVGSAITLYQNGSIVLRWLDATYTSGYPGYAQFSSVNLSHSVRCRHGVDIPLCNRMASGRSREHWLDLLRSLEIFQAAGAALQTQRCCMKATHKFSRALSTRCGSLRVIQLLRQTRIMQNHPMVRIGAVTAVQFFPVMALHLSSKTAQPTICTSSPLRVRVQESLLSTQVRTESTGRSKRRIFLAIWAARAFGMVSSSGTSNPLPLSAGHGMPCTRAEITQPPIN